MDILRAKYSSVLMKPLVVVNRSIKWPGGRRNYFISVSIKFKTEFPKIYTVLVLPNKKNLNENLYFLKKTGGPVL